MTNCRNWNAGNKYALFFKGQNFTAEVDSVCDYSGERFPPCEKAGFLLSAFRRYNCFDMVGSEVS